MKLIKYFFVFVFFSIISTSLADDKLPSINEDDVKRINGVTSEVHKLIPRSHKPPVIQNACDLNKDVLMLSNARIIDLVAKCNKDNAKWVRLNQ